MTYLGERVQYQRLKQRLGTTESGTPFPNIDRLRSWRLIIERSQGNLVTLRQRLATGQPVIVPVATELLPYWLLRPDFSRAEHITEHAIVVVGLDEQYLYVNDPDFVEAPQVVEIAWFMDAWQHHNLWYAVIRRRWG
jgi:predicted double-glycine peptidase